MEFGNEGKSDFSRAIGDHLPGAEDGTNGADGTDGGWARATSEEGTARTAPGPCMLKIG